MWKPTRDESLIDPIGQRPEGISTITTAAFRTATNDVFLWEKRSESTVRMNAGTIRGDTGRCDRLKISFLKNHYFEKKNQGQLSEFCH